MSDFPEPPSEDRLRLQAAGQRAGMASHLAQLGVEAEPVERARLFSQAARILREAADILEGVEIPVKTDFRDAATRFHLSPGLPEPEPEPYLRGLYPARHDPPTVPPPPAFGKRKKEKKR